MAVCVLVKVCTLVGNFSDPLPGDFDFGTYSISDTLWEEKQCEMGSTTLELDVFLYSYLDTFWEKKYRENCWVGKKQERTIERNVCRNCT